MISIHTKICTLYPQAYVDETSCNQAFVNLYAVDEGLCGRNILQSVAIGRLILLHMYIYAHQDLFGSWHNIEVSLYDIKDYVMKDIRLARVDVQLYA